MENIKAWAKFYHRPEYKTAIKGDDEYLHHIVTRVNYLTAKLWLENVYSKANGKSGFPLIPNSKPNWMCMIRQFRREKEKEILNH